MEKTKKIGMKWYNYLVHFWLPLNIFLNLLLIVLVGRFLYPVIAALFSSQYAINYTEIDGFLFLLYFVLFVCILPFFTTIGTRRSLKKCKPNAFGNLVFWYIDPILNFILFDALLFVSGGTMPEELKIVFLFFVLRALIMIFLNGRYFDRRAELFGLYPKRSRKQQTETDQAPAEIPQELPKPAPQKTKKRRKNPAKLLRRATRKLFVLNDEHQLPF